MSTKILRQPKYAQLENAVKDLFAIPVEENADSAYNEMRTIMESIFASNKDTKNY